MKKNFSYNIYDAEVSVPYRGYSFFNIVTLILLSWLYSVSVPYRGYSFFNLYKIEGLEGCYCAKFPSLTGVIRFLMKIQKKQMV